MEFGNMRLVYSQIYFTARHIFEQVFCSYTLILSFLYCIFVVHYRVLDTEKSFQQTNYHN